MGTKGTTCPRIDGGGTLSRARIDDENARVLSEASSGLAQTRIGFEKTRRSMEATEAAAAQAGVMLEDFARMYTGIGLAGLSRRGAALQAAPWSEEAMATDDATFAPIVMGNSNPDDPASRRMVERAAAATGDLLDLFLARRIDPLSLGGGLADAIAPWLMPDLRGRLNRSDADTAGALLMARGWVEVPKRETDDEQAAKFHL
jgi:N-acetylglucosamine kinase-like BadF-type ATPase